MKRKIPTFAISVLLLVAAASLFVFLNRPPSPALGSRPVPASNPQPSRKVARQASHPGQPHRESYHEPRADDGAEERPASRVLAAEAPLITEIDGVRGVDLRASTQLMMGDHFGDFLDGLSRESSISPLARDITELYGRSAAEANSVVDNEVGIVMACGTTVCGLSATAPDKETFDAWHKTFLGNQSAPPHAAGRYDMLPDDGSIEYRMIFSTDPERAVPIAHPD